MGEWIALIAALLFVCGALYWADAQIDRRDDDDWNDY